MDILKAALIALYSIIAFFAFNLGMDYVNFGHGLHPALAFPIATVFFLLACLYGGWMGESDEDCKALTDE